MGREVGDRDKESPMSYPEFPGWKEQKPNLPSVGRYSWIVDLTRYGEPQHFESSSFTARAFADAGKTAARPGASRTGRIASGSSGGNISDYLAQYFMGYPPPPCRLGGKLTLNNTLFTQLSGVLPPDFPLATDPRPILPLRLDAIAAPRFNFLHGVGKRVPADPAARSEAPRRQRSRGM